LLIVPQDVDCVSQTLEIEGVQTLSVKDLPTQPDPGVRLGPSSDTPRTVRSGQYQ
jgi:hypothetical protein